ncbi:hypothetical protein O181_035574 [Austropuccinia psidii MF-1]|uniref:Integrase catalytic domain-containing protein n=1 Tax=Austropuccinia psidii MF-1 TaxID=1389203 RepID=A0A9Q3D2W9_9BASI|nr:hypothetical protein [Austropuccinia psidii MF-1]
MEDKHYKEILTQLARGELVSYYSLKPLAKLLLSKDRVVVPSQKEIQLNILQKHHNSLLAGHPAQEKTLKLIKRDFYWDGMNKFIKDYVSSSEQCSRNKNIHHKKFGLLKHLQITSVVVDRFSKMAIFIPAYGAITALDLAQIFINHVFSKNGLPESIISDRGSLFLSSFWTQLCQQLKISRDLSTPFLLEQMDRQRGNPSFDSIHISQDSPSGKLSTKLQSVQQVVKEELESEIRRFKKYADKNRSIPPDFQPGDKVWLASKSIKATTPTKKLSEEGLGPFKFLKKIGSHAYHLKLHQQWKSAHPVFHVSLLEPVKQSTIPN